MSQLTKAEEEAIERRAFMQMRGLYQDDERVMKRVQEAPEGAIYDEGDQLFEAMRTAIGEPEPPKLRKVDITAGGSECAWCVEPVEKVCQGCSTPSCAVHVRKDGACVKCGGLMRKAISGEEDQTDEEIAAEPNPPPAMGHEGPVDDNGNPKGMQPEDTDSGDRADVEDEDEDEEQPPKGDVEPARPSDTEEEEPGQSLPNKSASVTLAKASDLFDGEPTLTEVKALPDLEKGLKHACRDCGKSLAEAVPYENAFCSECAQKHSAPTPSEPKLEPIGKAYDLTLEQIEIVKAFIPFASTLIRAWTNGDDKKKREIEALLAEYGTTIETLKSEFGAKRPTYHDYSLADRDWSIRNHQINAYDGMAHMLKSTAAVVGLGLTAQDLEGAACAHHNVEGGVCKACGERVTPEIEKDPVAKAETESTEDQALDDEHKRELELSDAARNAHGICKACRKEKRVYDTGDVLGDAAMRHLGSPLCSECIEVPLKKAGGDLSILKGKPSLATMKRWMEDGVAEATDGCRVEPDGYCEHGKPSWLIALGMI